MLEIKPNTKQQECIDNIEVGMISKMCKSKDYKPRSRKYIYQIATEEEFNQKKAELLSKL